MTQKQQLYYLVRKYKVGKYDTNTFCDELSRVFYHTKGDDDLLSDREKILFKELADKCNRFSPYEEDLCHYPKVFYNVVEIDTIIKHYGDLLLNQ